MATAWTWILIYVLGFAAFQLLIYRYLRENEPSIKQATPGYTESERDAAQPGLEAPTEPVGAENGDGIRCRHCGTVNESEQAFTYCRECIRPLQ